MLGNIIVQGERPENKEDINHKRVGPQTGNDAIHNKRARDAEELSSKCYFVTLVSC